MRAPNNNPHPNLRERGQALVEYALITVLIGLTFGAGLAATGPVVGNLFDRIVDDVLRQTAIVDAPGGVEFWNTVTSVFEYVPTGGGIATNTKAPPTPVDTPGGPTPVFTNTFTPSPTQPTSTPKPTKTPGDIQKNAPFKDTVDEAGWWRMDSNINLSGMPWKVDFYDNINLSGSIKITQPGLMGIDYNGLFVSGFPSAAPGQNFSVRFERTIEFVDDPVTPAVETQALTFRLLADDGVRVFIDGVALTLRDPNNNTTSWADQTAPMLWTGITVVNSGAPHTVIVEYYNKTGTARLKVDITGGAANPDDRANTVGNPFACNWGQLTNSNDANTESNMFDDYLGGPSAANTTCYLEWRGSVIMPVTMLRPELAFWDVWDLPVGSEAWVEVAEYIPLDAAAFPQTANRTAMTWQRVNLSHTTGGTANYNWTRNAIDLTPLMVSFSTTPKHLTFRFVIKTTSVVSLTKWIIDDIEVRDATSTLITANKLWTLDNADERFDFIVDGGRSNPGDESGWRLVSNNRYGTGGLGWHDSADPVVDDPNDVAGGGPNGVNGYTPYKRHSGSPNTNLLKDVRVHALEFNGFIDLANVPTPDLKGNTGVPTLSFYHGFHVGDKTGLQVQYTTDGYSVSPANWLTLPGGLIRDITVTGELRNPTLQELAIPLNGLPGNPPQIRLRFAMLVHSQAVVKDGWWIDQILLGRAEAPKWLNYPFVDDAQGNGQQLFWSYSGLWEPTDSIAFAGLNPTNGVTPISYASSPRGGYSDSTTTYMTMRWPIDLYNDTPSKLVLQDATGTIITSNTQGAPAIVPELTFVQWHEIAATDDFRIEWKRASEPAASWRVLWMYRRGMATNPAGANSRTAINKSWEFTRVSLYPILKQFTTDANGAPGVGTGAQLADDDIMLRFGLKADSSNSDDGVFIDDIRIGNNSGEVLKLWPSNENRVNPFNSTSLGVGTGAIFVVEPDFVTTNKEWWEVLRVGSGWNAVSYDARGGALSLHESSIGGQDRAPTGYRNVATGNDDFGDTAWRTPIDSYSVMELEPIIDLRAVFGEDEAPMLSFWTHYHIGADDYVRVEISVEDTRAAATIDNDMLVTRCANQGVIQCYHQERGWSAWTTAWTRGSNSSTTGYGWQKAVVNLAPYAYLANSNTQGKRIRIRFVYDALDNDSNRDGWYIDNIRLEHRLPNPLTTNLNLAEFDDRSRNITNWTAEGKWGLDVAVFQGGGGGPVTLGVWDVKWWDCANCPNLAPGGTSNNNKLREGTKVFLQNPTPAAGDRSQLVTNINYRFFSGSPVSGWTKTDNLVMRAVVDTPVVGGIDFPSGVRSFTTRADDGVRLKIEELVAGVPVLPTPVEWNVVNRWTDSSEVADQGTFAFVNGKRYRITLQYYEKTGDGTVTLSVTDGRFSFSDSPKASGGPIPDVKPIPYSNTSLILKNVLNLTEVPTSAMVLLEYQTKYRLASNTNARLEVSVDGGFTWTNANLTAAAPPAFSAYSFSFNGTSFGNTTYGVTTPGIEPWEVRTNNLTSYIGQNILLRFRMDRLTTYCVKKEDCDGSDAEGNASLNLVDTYYDGWWITPIRVIKFEA